MGDETARAARAAGFEDVRNAGGDARALADLILRDLPPPAGLLLAVGRDRKAEPEARLRQGGYDLATWIVYEAEAVAALPDPVRTALGAGTVEAVLHYSRRSAGILLRLADAAGLGAEARNLLHVCLSADVAAGLAGCARIRLAASPDERALLASLDR